MRRTAWKVRSRARSIFSSEKASPTASRGWTAATDQLRWASATIASAIVGASRPDQLDDNAAAADLVIDPALFAKAEAIVAGVERAR